MKCLKYCFIVMLILISAGMTPDNQKVLSIEGLSYLDNSPIRVNILNGKILSIKRLKKLSDNNKNTYIGPGFIDNQVNGFNGVSFVFGGGNLTAEGVQKVNKSLWEVGVTSYLPTLTTNDHKILLNSISILAKAKDDPASRGSIVGFHLEGPYISPVDGYRGAHPLKFVRKPDWNEFMELFDTSKGNILQVTLAPEVEGAMEFITNCREKNIVVALGHHNAPTKVVTEAIDRGAQISTHMGNGIANNINRHLNPFWSQLSDDRLMISIIGDGFHLLPEEIRVFYKAKGTNKTIITSDVTSYGGMPPAKYINEDGDTIEHTPEGALIYPAQKVLYGSASPVTKGVGNVMKVTGCSLGDAIQMASTNPARLYGLKDRGELKPGLRADIIVFSVENSKIIIKKTIVAGEVVYSAQN